MSFDLRTESWIPFRRASGRVESGSPVLLVDALGSDPVVAIETPRPDFDGALHEFLIGLLTVAMAPEDEDAWLRWWDNPPTPDELRAAFAALPRAFDLDGDGPRAFQDRTRTDFDDEQPSSIAQLLIDAPGEQGIRQNKDLFVKRDRVHHVSRAVGAMALVTMQTYAPAGGAGNRTSLRGGGPLTTLVDPRAGTGRRALWYLLWANVETMEQREARAAMREGATVADVFPWLGPTRGSDTKKGGGPTTPRDADPCQVYFGLPRRLRLEFGTAASCDLTGIEDAVTVTGFRQRPYGVQYLGWHHPLTPHYESKDGWLPLHGQPDGLVWRDWLSLVVADGTPGRRPAQVVTHFLRSRAKAVRCERPSIVAFGYDMDSMKARGWVEARLPACTLDDPDTTDRIAGLARRLVEGTSFAASSLQFAVKDALFGTADAPGDLSHVKQALWHATESAFYASLDALVRGTSADDLVPVFRETLEREALAIFDRVAGIESTRLDAMRRLVGARFSLTLTLRGRSKQGQKLFTAFALPLPEPSPARAARPAATEAPVAARGRGKSTRTRPAS